jgi:serine protease Do/serine protease DegQ
MTAIALVLAVPLTVPSAYAEVATSSRDAMPSLAPLVAQVTPAVVSISVKKVTKSEMPEQSLAPSLRRFFQNPGDLPDEEQKPREEVAVGSGVIIDADKAYILTNHHVIADAKEITVTLSDRREFTAKLLGSDEGTDIALLQIDAKNLTAIPIGDSRVLKVGDYVIAVGNPFGLGETVTSGIVSAVGRSGLNIEGYEDFIQTDASINPGNSGGALVNLKGELVGINTAIIGPSGGNVGIGFAVPTAMANTVVAQLAKSGKVERGRIGVQVHDMTPALAKNLGVDGSNGALVEKVDQGSPADSAGVKAGDVVVALNGAPITGSSDLRNRIGMLPVGSSVHLAVLRDNAKKDITVALGKAQEDMKVLAAVERPTLEGASFSDADRNDGGIRVTDVAHDTPAWEVGLRPNDIIVAVNRQPMRKVEDFNTALKTSRQAALFIKRGDERVVIVV